MRVAVVNGPNLNLLGTREPDVYGTTTLAELDALVRRWAGSLGVDVTTFQSNHEGALIDHLHSLRGRCEGIVLNPGALTHYSYALHDAITGVGIPTVETHISNIHDREPWRRHSVVAPACAYTIFGRGIDGYRWALRRLVAMVTNPCDTLPYGDGPERVGDLRLPEGAGPHPVAVLLHGGFWRDPWTRDTLDPAAMALTHAGWATWNVEYHRVGNGGGWPATLEDVAAAIDHLSGIDSLDLDRVVAIGHSAGGQLALWAASRHRLPHGAPGAGPRVTPCGAVGLAPVADLTEAHRLGIGNHAVEALLRRDPHDGPDRYEVADPARLLPSGVPTVLVHGAGDDTVPPVLSERYVAAARVAGDDASLVLLDGAGHMDLAEPSAPSWSVVLAAVERVSSSRRRV